MPTKYKEELCEELVDHMKEGFSFESFGAVANVDRATLFRWKNKHDEFKEAYELGFVHSLFNWEKVGKEGLYMGGKDNPFNSAVWIFNMKNRFNWTDKKEIEAKVEVKTPLFKVVNYDDDSGN